MIFKRKDDDTGELPPLPSKEEAEAALAHAEHAYSETPGMWRKVKVGQDILVDTIIKAIREG